MSSTTSSSVSNTPVEGDSYPSNGDQIYLPTTFTKFIIIFLAKYKKYVFILFIFAIITGLYTVVNSYLTKQVIDLVNTCSGEQLKKAALIPAILFILNHKLNSVAWRMLQYVNLKTVPVIKIDVINKTFAYVHKHSHNFFQDNFSGTISNNINTLAHHVERVISWRITHIIHGTIKLLLSLIGMYFIHPVFMIMMLLWTIIFLGCSLPYSKRIISFSSEYAESQSVLSGKIVDSITNAFNTRIFAQEYFEFSYLKKYLDYTIEKYRNKEWFLLKFHFIQALSVTILIGFVLFFLIRLQLEGKVNAGDFAFILGLVIALTETVWWINEEIDQLNESVGLCNQSLQRLFLPLEIVDTPGATELKVIRGEIKFNEVEFAYKNSKPLFYKKSVTILPGQKVGLVGYSGSGKSTFINLIIRLFDVTKGNILIDNQDISKVTQASLRNSISMIPQDPSLFHRSLMDNIRYARSNASDEEVIEAAKRAHAHEFIIRMPEGYHTLAGERGVKISGGQRQRISIARAILKNSHILFLDEATSQLDSLTEEEIQASLWEVMEGKTTLVIAHRLSTLKHMDRILVFDKGEIIQDGTLSELLTENNLFKKMWDTQAKGMLPENAV